MILAGGLGTRLLPLTRSIPKPMVPVRGVPYLEHQLRLLARQSITDVVMLTGYLGEQIEQYFRDGAWLDLRIRYSHEKSPLGTGGALREAAALLADAFVVIYGDSFLPIQYKDVLERLSSCGVDGVVVVYSDPSGETDVRNNIALDSEGWVTRYDKSSGDAGLQFVEAGVLAFRRNIVQEIPGNEALSLEGEVFPRLIAKRELVAFLSPQRFYDIGTLERLRSIEQFLS